MTTPIPWEQLQEIELALRCFVWIIALFAGTALCWDRLMAVFGLGTYDRSSDDEDWSVDELIEELEGEPLTYQQSATLIRLAHESQDQRARAAAVAYATTKPPNVLPMSHWRQTPHDYKPSEEGGGGGCKLCAGNEGAAIHHISEEAKP